MTPATVLVVGLGVSGRAAAAALAADGWEVLVSDADPAQLDRAREAGYRQVPAGTLPAQVRLVVLSPGVPPIDPLVSAARAAGVEVIGEVELAWRLRPDPAPPWLGVTGTNGKTTTVRMLADILAAAGRRTVAAGNVGLPLVQVVRDPALELIAVELSSAQLHFAPSVRCAAAAILNIAPDHLDWHGDFAAYAAAKSRIWAGGVAVGNLDDEVTAGLLAAAPGRQVGFTLAPPAPGQLGLVDDTLVDRAFGAGPAPLLPATELPTRGRHNVANALAAAALARSAGVEPAAVAAGLRGFVPDPHRNQLVGSFGGVAWVDDSKATNPPAAAASLLSYRPVVWLAGGLLKGADVDDLVRSAADRLRAVVLFGTDRAQLREALRRHAPQVPVREVTRLDTGAMAEAVTQARKLAQPGDTVLLAPAAASWDCFANYGERGDLFAAAASGAGS